MAIYRNVQLSFWTDNKVEDDFSPEDKYFYLYLLTNPQTNLCGCYELSWSQSTRQTGYNKDTIIRLLDRFENVYKMVKFNSETKEVLILNWYRYNWSKSEDTLKGVLKTAEHIKCEEFKKYVFDVVEMVRAGKNGKPPMNNVVTSSSDAVSANVTDSITDIYKEIVDYLNMVLGTNYRYTTKKTQDYILARLNEKFTVSDFKIVIDKKAKEWIGTEWEKFLRPETLFSNKFEGYLNQTVVNGKKKQQDTKWS